MLDHRGLDLAAARRVRYILEQSFRYEYDAPVESLRQRLVIVPPARHGNQYLRAHRLEVTGAKARRRVRRDAAGNVVAWLQADHVPAAIEFRLAAVLERVRDDGPAVLPAAALHSPRLLRPTRLTAPDERLRALAADIAAGTRPPVPVPRTRRPEDLAERICAAVSSAITYEYGVTTVSTTAAEALACGRGVCQDSAHVMLALCHLLRTAGQVRVRPPARPGRHPRLGRGDRARATGTRRGHRLRPVSRPPHRRRLRHRRHRPRLRRRRPHLRLLRRRFRRAA